MLTPNGTPGMDAEGYPFTECSLASLKSRSQIDFEIDFFERILSRDPAYIEVLCNLGELFSIKGWARRALQVDRRLAQLRPEDPLVLYNLACSYALLRQSAKTIATLRRAIEVGYRDFSHMEQDPDLDGIRQTPEFGAFMQEPLVLYSLACSHALLQQTEETVAALRSAVEAGYRDLEQLSQDPELDSIRQSPEFINFMKDMKDVVDTGSQTRIV